MKRIQDLIRNLAGKRHYSLVRYEAKHRRAWMDAVTAAQSERPLLLNHCEACQLISAVTATGKLGGNMAELGVAYGASAKLICDFAPGRTLHLFDTFDGLPAPAERDSVKFAAKQFQSGIESVRRYLDGRDVVFHKGLFPATAAPVSGMVFSFVHLDADLYESTIEGLKFFYPRLCPGGIILCHDYLSADGVDAAVREYFADKPEPVIELTGYQCMIVKAAGRAVGNDEPGALQEDLRRLSRTPAGR